MKEQDKRRLYGQLLLDFANSKTTDEAGLGYLSNLQKVYGFSDGFVTKTHAGFPRMLNSSDPENKKPENKKIIELMSKENNLHSKINDFLQGKAHLLYYDNKFGGALVLDTEIVLDASDGVEIEFLNHPTPYYIKDLMNKDDFFYNISEPHLEQLIDVEDGEEYEDYIYPEFTEIKANILEWVQIVKELTDYKEKNPPYTYSDQSLDESRFQVALGEHYYIQTCIDIQRNLLQAIVNKDLNTAMKIAQRFINVYNKTVSKPIANITNQLAVSIEKKFREDMFLNRDIVNYPIFMVLHTEAYLDSCKA